MTAKTTAKTEKTEPAKPKARVKAKSAPKAKDAGGVSKLRIRVRAYEYKILDVSVKQIIEALTNLSLPSGVNIDVKIM